MNIITTPKANTAMAVNGGFARVCGKCSGTGIYYRRIQTPDGWGSVQDVCFPCAGTGHIGKVYAQVNDFDKARATAEKAQARREEKRQAESEAGRQEREAEEARRAIEAADREAELATWKHLDAQVGDKVTVTGTIVTKVAIETMYGMTNLIVIDTENKEAVKMFTTAAWSENVNNGDIVTIEGQVKNFDNYEGKAQTIIARPKSI